MTKNASSPALPLDEHGVRAAVARAEKAWNAADHVAFAACMAEDVDVVGLLGERYHGRDVVELGHKHIFETIYKDSRVTYTIEQLRFLRADVAVVILHQTMRSYLPPHVVISTARQRQMSDEMHDSEARATLTLVKQSRSWAISAFHNTAVASTVTALA
jgi:uncharacterized protein (TIGR02246 family)